jgi:CubicO group peptidase (beta-lactamase class C family)
MRNRTWKRPVPPYPNHVRMSAPGRHIADPGDRQAESGDDGLPQPRSFPMRTRSSITIVLSSVFLILSARNAMAWCPAYPLPETGTYNSEFVPIDNYVQQWAKNNQVAAATLAITYDKKLVYERGFGYQDSNCAQQILPDAKMRLATNSEAMTRRALQQLIADGVLTPTRKVQDFLNQFFTLPTSPDPRMANIEVEDIYNFKTCTSEASYIDNIHVGENQKLGRPATATERIKYLWANPQFTGLIAGCTPGTTFSGSTHVSHEIAGVIIAAAACEKLSGSSGCNVSSLTSATGVGNWYGAYVNSVVGQHVGASLWQASDDYAGAPGSPIPNEIWYDSSGLGTACPEWNYWPCAFANPPTQAPVPAAYATDYYARPGSGTVVASARDVARFMVSYHWADDDAALSNSVSTLVSQDWGCCLGGALPGTTTLMGDEFSKYGGQFGGQSHFWNWVLLTNLDNVEDVVSGTPFDLTALLDNPENTGLFDTYEPTADIFVDDVLTNLWAGQIAYAPSNPSGPPVVYDTATQTSSNPYFPYNTLPDPKWLWRIQPDVNGYDQLTNEGTSALMLTNHDNESYVELLPPNNTLHSYEWSLVPSPIAKYVEIMSRAVSANGLNVQDQKGYVEQGPIQSTWWSADWLMTREPSGLCCTNMTSTVSCPAVSKVCLCGDIDCPMYTIP